eukprot:CAMPEP_0202783760 /NCGR_PEP_ID=MMETSP1388-20130828/65052_1 /ASSEMBLY_ACC=CAM_ASM_000864 /TAXON_ID=37098 /ORGANISM="Isochrysis sp, Strain CCMP1244" /LENGTH=94 /DNA_ID=CAMNT_0049453233 /DNA_START=36 /DNA_END=316 /DNA_ORIENTATION=+
MFGLERVVRWLLKGWFRLERKDVVVSATRLELARLELVVDAWNQVLGWAGLCLASGSARRIAVAMPWAAPLPSGSRVEVHGLRATLQRLPATLP